MSAQNFSMKCGEAISVRLLEFGDTLSWYRLRKIC